MFNYKTIIYRVTLIVCTVTKIGQDSKEKFNIMLSILLNDH